MSQCSPVSRRFRPQLEWLEERDCPSCTPPTLLVDVEYLTQNEIRVFGQVTAQVPQDTMVYALGSAYGMVVPDANGYFTMTISASIGQMEVYVSDFHSPCPETGQYMYSETVYFVLSSEPPEFLTFNSSLIGGNMWEVSGTISDECPAGLTISFSGTVWSLNMLTTQVQSDGSFALAFEVMDDEEGWASAIVTDWWGLEATSYLVQIRPTDG